MFFSPFCSIIVVLFNTMLPILLKYQLTILLNQFSFLNTLCDLLDVCNKSFELKHCIHFLFVQTMFVINCTTFNIFIMPLASGVHLGKNLEENVLNNTIKMY